MYTAAEAVRRRAAAWRGKPRVLGRRACLHFAAEAAAHHTAADRLAVLGNRKGGARHSYARKSRASAAYSVGRALAHERGGY